MTGFKFYVDEIQKSSVFFLPSFSALGPQHISSVCAIEQIERLATDLVLI